MAGAYCSVPRLVVHNRNERRSVNCIRSIDSKRMFRTHIHETFHALIAFDPKDLEVDAERSDRIDDGNDQCDAKVWETVIEFRIRTSFHIVLRATPYYILYTFRFVFFLVIVHGPRSWIDVIIVERVHRREWPSNVTIVANTLKKRNCKRKCGSDRENEYSVRSMRFKHQTENRE